MIDLNNSKLKYFLSLENRGRYKLIKYNNHLKNSSNFRVIPESKYIYKNIKRKLKWLIKWKVMELAIHYMKKKKNPTKK